MDGRHRPPEDAIGSPALDDQPEKPGACSQVAQDPREILRTISLWCQGNVPGLEMMRASIAILNGDSQDRIGYRLLGKVSEPGGNLDRFADLIAILAGWKFRHNFYPRFYLDKLSCQRCSSRILVSHVEEVRSRGCGTA